MKKVKVMLLMISLAGVLTACGTANTDDTTNVVEQEETVVSEQEEPETEEESVAEEPVAEESIVEEPDFVSETDYVSITGLYVDDSYVDEDNANMKMLYVFYDAFTNAENLEVCSKNSKITANDVNTYFSENYPGACDLMSSYYYSNYLEDIYVGDKLKVVSTFKIPAAELEAGRVLAIEPHGIPDGDKIRMSTDDIVVCASTEEVAKSADPEGFEAYSKNYELADEETTSKVKKCINGYYWSFYVNNTSYEIEFYSPDKFEVRVKALGVANGGTYEVRNGFVTITYDSNGSTVDIPWTWNGEDVDMDFTKAFDVNE